jgi:hypothetical protein
VSAVAAPEVAAPVLDLPTFDPGRLVDLYPMRDDGRLPQVGDVAHCGYVKRTPPAPVSGPERRCGICTEIAAREGRVAVDRRPRA